MPTARLQVLRRATWALSCAEGASEAEPVERRAEAGVSGRTEGGRAGKQKRLARGASRPYWKIVCPDRGRRPSRTRIGERGTGLDPGASGFQSGVLSRLDSPDVVSSSERKKRYEPGRQEQYPSRENSFSEGESSARADSGAPGGVRERGRRVGKEKAGRTVATVR